MSETLTEEDKRLHREKMEKKTCALLKASEAEVAALWNERVFWACDVSVGGCS